MTSYLRPETAQGIFINFKNVAQLARRKPPFGIAQIGKAFRNEITPGNFIFRTLEFEQMEMEFFVPPAEARRSGTATGSRSASPGTCGTASGRATCACARTTPRSSRTTRRHERHRVPPSDRLVRARRDCASAATSTSRQHTQASGTKLEWVDARGSATRRMSSSPRSASTARCSRSSSTHTTRRSSPNGSAPCSGSTRPRAREGSGAPADPKDAAWSEGAGALRGAAPACRRVRRLRPDRPPLPPPGRDRHAVRADRSTSRRSRTTRSRPRPRFARAGAHLRSRGHERSCSTSWPRTGAPRSPRRSSA